MQLLCGYNLQGNGFIPYTEGLFVGYKRYEDRQIRPLFPFGHRLSYTTFEHLDIEVLPLPKSIMEGGMVDVRITVQNSGDREGKETVQVFINDVESAFTRPLSELRGFTKISLKPNLRAAFALFDDFVNKFRVEEGEFIIQVGSSSAELRLQSPISPILLGPEHAGKFVF
ncbi:hypothetical protein JCM24511_10205 [Saitozyma sp. JCM 24511]|nr:hypothetical protein JCM24511_10205 [Saitozyma sp. JCM 24511]